MGAVFGFSWRVQSDSCGRRSPLFNQQRRARRWPVLCGWRGSPSDNSVRGTFGLSPCAGTLDWRHATRLARATCEPMNQQRLLSLLGLSLSVLALIQAPAVLAVETKPAIIVSPREASWMETLAAHEVRRYVYLRTGRLLPMMTQPEGIAAQRGPYSGCARRQAVTSRLGVPGPLVSLAPQRYWLKTISGPTFVRRGHEGADADRW